MLILHLDFSDSLTALQTDSDSLILKAIRLYCCLCLAQRWRWARDAPNSGAAAAAGARCALWPGVRLSKRCGNGRAPWPATGTKPRLATACGNVSFASCCQVFLFFMNFAAFAGTEIAQKLLLSLRLPARLCGLPVSFRTRGGCSALCGSQSHLGVRCWDGWGVKILPHSGKWVSFCHLLGG